MNFQGKIVFVSGAITGVEGYRKVFAAAEQWLLEQDCTVLNPAVLPPSGLEWEAYLRITKALMSLYTMDDLRQDAKKEGH